MAPVLALLLSTLVAGSAALPTTRESPSGQRYGPVSATRDYLCFDGTDATADAAQWLPFNQLWSLNEPTILSKNGGDTYITHYIREAIEQVSCDREVDASLVLAIVMQESSGRASMPCKPQASGGKSRCGIMQSVGGSSFDAERPRASISRMIREGVEGDGFHQTREGDARYLTDLANRLLGWTGTSRADASCGQ
ncbi:hypothetical protein LTR97_005386 [Elasticomyces elasticus]|uniref:Transglycosylase SLT domain-containing protein n=1 Tax=Elasticomyces elasticus TaxID=574655 RepID=A0AAN7W5W9_9PEZI|nr:hypothetical protein LTR97_005386 [Elasticomyces elasticus]